MSIQKIGLSDNFGVNLKTVRKFLKLTQGRFAEPLSISGSYVSDIERGKAEPSDAVVKEMVNEYRISRLFLGSGLGEMFITPENFEFTDMDRRIYEQTRGLSEEEKRAVEKYIEDYKLLQELKKERADKLAA